MATNDLDSSDVKKQEELEDITTCCICTEVFIDPKGLPCMHTFCMKCIQKTGLKTNRGPGDKTPCPICRQQFKIPSAGFRGLPKNFFVDRLIGLRAANVSDPMVIGKVLHVCSECLEENMEREGKETPTADAYCIKCKLKLCEGCWSKHRKFKLTRNHKLIPVNEYESATSEKSNLSPGVCDLHPQELLDVYCTDCRTVVCAVCFIDDHNNHKGGGVDTLVHDFRKQIESNTEAINDCKAKAQAKQAELLEVREETKRSVEKLEGDVESRTDKLKQLIDKHKTTLLKGLCAIKERHLEETQIATDDIDEYLTCLETNNFCSQKGSDSDICGAFSKLSVRAVELQQKCHSMLEREIQSLNFGLRKSEIEDFLLENCDNLIGEIEENRQKRLNIEDKLKQELNEDEKRMLLLTQEKQRLLAELRYISDPVLVHTIRTNSTQRKRQFGTAEESKNRDISGVAILDEELFVVIETNSEVEVYNSIKFNICRRWNLKELIDPRDIASCKINRCLYILDCKGDDQSKEILRVDPNGKLIKTWSTGVDLADKKGRVFGLSVMGEANVVLSDFNEHKLKEYLPDGQFIREIHLSSDVGNPSHAIKLTNGNFLVCCGSLGDDLHGGPTLFTVDVDGKLTRSFSGICGSIVRQINYPIYLSVDGNGYVIVVDWGNCRVLLLDSDLKFKREILSRDRHGLQWPERILLDESNGRLFMADNDWNNQRILIFEFK